MAFGSFTGASGFRPPIMSAATPAFSTMGPGDGRAPAIGAPASSNPFGSIFARNFADTPEAKRRRRLSAPSMLGDRGSLFPASSMTGRAAPMPWSAISGLGQSMSSWGMIR
jgi:hypothetical protein